MPERFKHLLKDSIGFRKSPIASSRISEIRMASSMNLYLQDCMDLTEDSIVVLESPMAFFKDSANVLEDSTSSIQDPTGSPRVSMN